MKGNTKKTLKVLLSILFVWGGLSAAWGLSLVRQPYLQMGTSDSVIVVWRTDAAANGWVRYGTSLNNLSEKSETSDPTTNQSVTISGLEPATRYYYTIHTDAGVITDPDENTYFETAPEVGSKTPVRMWVVGDSGTGGTAQKNVRDSMVNFVGENKPDLFLHMGDMAYSDGEDQEFTDRFYGIYSDILRNTVCWPTMGNHEGYTSNANSESGPYYEGYILPTNGEAGGLASGTEAYYSFDYANIHFIVLESHQSSREVTGPMLTWLEADLAATDQDWVIAYWHHGPYTKGSHDSDTESRHIDMRENALPILEAGGVDLVLAGHSHIYERTFLVDGAYDTPTTAEGHIVDNGDGKASGDGPYVKSPGLNPHEGAVYVTAGHGGASVSKDGTHPLVYFAEVKHGSCIIDVEGPRLTLMNVRDDGVSSDNFTIMKGDGIVLGAPIGGETLEADQTVDIKWKTLGSVPFVDIDYSLNGGGLWIPLTKGLANAGGFSWTIPNVDTTSARVRIQATGNGAIRDESKADFTITTELTQVLIPFGGIWKYHDENQDPGIAWNSLDYDDSTWDSGPGQLGYGDGDEATLLNDENPNVPTAYFRKRITVDTLPDNLKMTIVFDDGYAAFINGVEVARKNVDSLNFIAWSTEAGSDNSASTTQLGIGSELPLQEGDNIIAVMVKQRSDNSSDLSFDGQLLGGISQTKPNTPPNLTNPGPQTFEIGKKNILNLNATDADGDELVYLSSPLPAGASLNFKTGAFSWTPTPDQIGERNITFTVADLRGLSKSESVAFTVQESVATPTKDTTNSKDSATETVSVPNTDTEAPVDSTITSPPPKSSDSSGCVAFNGGIGAYSFWILCGALLFFVLRQRKTGIPN